MATSILGRHHPRLKHIRRSLRRGELTPDGLLPIEGRRLIEEAIRSGLEVVETFVRDGDPVDAGFPRARIVPEEVFRQLHGTRRPQGMVALVRPPRFTFDAVVAGAKPLVVVLCGLQDPGNAGTIIRLAEALGASGCVATAGTVGCYNDKLVRAAAGSLFRLPHVWNVESAAVFNELRAAGLRLVGAAADAPDDAAAYDWRGPSALLIGAEGSGLPRELRDCCDAMVAVRHHGVVDSLNAATAAAILLYEASRQRHRTPSG